MAGRAVSRPSRRANRLRAAHHDPPRHPRASTHQIQPRVLNRRSHLSRDCSIAHASPSWGAKRARSGAPGLSGRFRPPCLPCASAQIQPRIVKRRRHLLRDWSSIAQASLSWGAKGARGGTPVLSGCLVPPCASALVQSRGVKRPRLGTKPARNALGGIPEFSSCFIAPGPKRCFVHPLLAPSKALSGPDSWETRDWANLGDGPAGLIAELALANDVADYIRFRAVCRPWRRCSEDPRSQGSLDSRFLPRQWIMLDKSHCGPCRRRFLNVSTGKCIRTDLPELAGGHMWLAVTPEGLLLLLHERTLLVRLLNPLTRQLTDLPPVTGLLTEKEQRDLRSGRPLEKMLLVDGAGLADGASTVAVCFRRPTTVLAVSRPGDEHWTVADDREIDSALACAGRFYCAIMGSVMVLDTGDLDQQRPPRLRLVATADSSSSGSMPFYFFRICDSLHLVDNAGELMLVCCMLRQDSRKYQVFRVDLEAGVLAPAKDFRGRAVFMSMRRTISVPAGAFSSVSPDALYLGFDCPEKKQLDRIDSYNVADGSTEPSCHGLQPCSVVDCLSYCIRGNGRHLA